MDLMALVKEGFQSAAEHAASYKVGQSVLRHVDKALWVVEKCARWAVPPPLEPEERPQPELVRPLPWVLFLMMLLALRVTRESISLVNLVLGKPPLRSADVVTYIQGKRRYLRTLKYQGNRMMRARTGSSQEPWHSGLRSLFEFTMCFRRQSLQYGNNNTTSVSNNDEVLVVKRTKRVRQTASTAGEPSMERLIEKMMVDLDADSNDDSSYTLTNAPSVKSDGTDDTAESEPESHHNASAPSSPQTETPAEVVSPSIPAPVKEANDASPKRETEDKPQKPAEPPKTADSPKTSNSPKTTDSPKPKDETPQTPPKEPTTPEKSPKNNEEVALRPASTKKSPLLDSMAFIQNEKQAFARSPKKEQKMANGRTVKSTSDRNIGGDRRGPDLVRAASADLSTRGRKENARQTP